MISKLKTNVVLRAIALFGKPAARIVEYSMDNNFDMAKPRHADLTQRTRVSMID